MGRIPYRDEADRAQVHRIDTLRARGKRREVYSPSLDDSGREPFEPKEGREPTTVMVTDDDALGVASFAFMIPKVRNVVGHVCSKPLEFLAHLVKVFVPEDGVVLDPFAGSGPLAAVLETTGRRGVLVETMVVGK
jgi:hypothetical protein